MLAVFIMLNNFFHDLTSALWFISALTMWALERTAFSQGGEYTKALYKHVFPTLFKASVISIVSNLIFGGIRAWAYLDYEYLPAAGKGQLLALYIKHVILFGVVLAGIVIETRLYRRYRERGRVIQ